jgi:glycosyltransferase involved in cell wall biosynthesis
MSPSPSPHVTVCVPVYNGRNFLHTTLSSIQQQSHGNLTVLISDDASMDDSAEICLPFTQDPRFQLSVQPARLGWLGNTNWLLQAAQGDFVCLVPHDDVLDRRYIKTLLDCLLSEPHCVMAFCDIREFGLLEQILSQSALCGSAFERVLGFISKHYDGTAYRGLIRRQVIVEEGGLNRNPAGDFAADLIWLARVARAGELRRIPQVLYHKRRHRESASLQWGTWTDEMKSEAWFLHCRELLNVALGLDLTPAERGLIVRASVRRLLQSEPKLPFPFIRGLSKERKDSMVASLLNVSRKRARAPHGLPNTEVAYKVTDY